jgi:hypothetical protein
LTFAQPEEAETSDKAGRGSTAPRVAFRWVPAERPSLGWLQLWQLILREVTSQAVEAEPEGQDETC